VEQQKFGLTFGQSNFFVYLCSQNQQTNIYQIKIGRITIFHLYQYFKNIIIMKKKEYEKPCMKVYKLSQQPQVLVGSLTGNRNNPYGSPTDY
jgi:hypothetical protein